VKITRITRQQKRRGRKNIYADGQFVLGLSDETLMHAGLRTGDEITRERLDSLARMEERQRAKRVALRSIATRPRTVREIRDRLREAECGDQDIEAVISDLQRTGLLNDEEFAGMFVRDALAHRPTGPMLLRQKLLLHGLDRSLVDRTLREQLDTSDQEESALAAGRKYVAKKPAPANPQDRAKLRALVAAHLARRGFSWETISAVLPALLTET